MIKFKRVPEFCFAGLLCGLSLSPHALTPAPQASAEIRRTTFGVPHIRAQDERGLGYGIGYAYAQNNLCLLANQVVTVSAGVTSGSSRGPLSSATTSPAMCFSMG